MRRDASSAAPHALQDSAVRWVSHRRHLSSRPDGRSDYFDVLRLDEYSVAVCIADVCGKGMSAALMMANLQAAVKTCASKGIRPEELCGAVNRLMCGNMAEGFITFFYGVLDSSSKSLTYCNAPPECNQRNFWNPSSETCVTDFL